MKPSAPPAVAAAPVPASTAMAPKVVNGGASRPAPGVPGRGAPPPPPPPPPVSATPKEMYKALYNFTGQAGEMKLVKGEEVEVKEKDDNGKPFMYTSQPGKTLRFDRLVDGGQGRFRRMGTIELVRNTPRKDCLSDI